MSSFHSDLIYKGESKTLSPLFDIFALQIRLLPSAILFLDYLRSKQLLREQILGEMRCLLPEAVFIYSELGRKRRISPKDAHQNYFEASSIATATATVIPTMGLLPAPISPIISTWAGTEEEPAN